MFTEKELLKITPLLTDLRFYIPKLNFVLVFPFSLSQEFRTDLNVILILHRLEKDKIFFTILKLL